MLVSLTISGIGWRVFASFSSRIANYVQVVLDADQTVVCQISAYDSHFFFSNKFLLLLLTTTSSVCTATSLFVFFTQCFSLMLGNLCKHHAHTNINFNGSCIAHSFNAVQCSAVQGSFIVHERTNLIGARSIFPDI